MRRIFINKLGGTIMLNVDIRVDLHIHSYASKYKESDDIVDFSKTDNLGTLLDKLDSDDNQISLFSITDHNRFDSKLYMQARKLIINGEFNHIKEMIAGIEFDVLLESGMLPCHILTFFNAKSDKDLIHIESVINKYLLTKKDAFYDRAGYERILVDISLETILIVCQRKDLDNKNGKHTSLSDSTQNPFEYLQFGYFNALEYQKPGVEGILRNNLNKLNLDVALVLGSDCHDWSIYPQHSQKISKRAVNYSILRCLPSFKGLLLALTSPSTRFNRKSNSNENYVKNLEVNGQKIEFSAGINAIIGENGSGKSLLVELLTQQNNKLKPYYSKIVSKNNMKFDKVMENRCQIVKQGEIIDNKNKGSIFGSEGASLYKNINNQEFVNTVNGFTTALINQISRRIKFHEEKANLSKTIHKYNEAQSGSTYYINVIKTSNFEKIDNPHKVRADNIKAALNLIEHEINSQYYSKAEYQDLLLAYQTLNNLHKVLIGRNRQINFEISTKNAIVSKIDTYNMKKKVLLSTEDTKREAYSNERTMLIQSVVDTTIQQFFVEKSKPLHLRTFNTGYEDNLVNGFTFRRICKYYQSNLNNVIYEYIFNSGYKSYDDTMMIDSKNKFASAVKNAGGKIDKITESLNSNVTKFIDDFQKTDDYILDFNSSNSKIGNTLGEMSLVYYKFKTYYSRDWDVLIIDQPEDNISNPKIKDDLSTYFNNLRDFKQIIYVTHNPLLVVNQDVDNVIFVNKNNDNIEIKSGCLEREDINILKVVAENMDGGSDTIEKRLKYYGKSN